MAVIGNSSTQQAFTPAVDYFSGNASTTAFTLSRPVASVAQVQVVVNNVAQNPSSAYTVSSNTITFTSAPSSGTNNIYVYYTSPITQVIAPGQNTVYPTSLSTTNALYWDTSGNVGIGTTSPSVKLDIVGSVAISGGISGAVVATQATQETSTSTSTIVTPGRQQYHPSAAKAWIQCNNNGAIAGSYNIASIADTGVGVVTVTLTTAFSSTSYSVLGSSNGGGGGLFAGAGITSASVFTLVSFNTLTQSAQDSGIYCGVAFGDQ